MAMGGVAAPWAEGRESMPRAHDEACARCTLSRPSAARPPDARQDRAAPAYTCGVALTTRREKWSAPGRVARPHGGEAMSIEWTAFTPWSAMAGGAIIGFAAAMFALVNGRIAGVSGIVGGLLRPALSDVGWRAAFIAGLVAAPIVYVAVAPLPPIVIDGGYPVLILAGLLVGVGTRY